MVTTGWRDTPNWALPRGIIPPYVLEAVAASGSDEPARRAQATLEHDRTLRAERGAGAWASEPGRPRVAADDGKGPARSVHDARHGVALPGTKVRGEGDPATGDASADEAYDGLGDTWRLLHDALGRDSLDDRGLGLVATVHYGRDYVNAFWDGRQMVFGDGDGEIFLSFTRSLDVIGHELAHGLTQYTAGLHYADQSGALNEHISDVFGVTVKQFALGQSAAEADWLIGAELLAPGVRGVALRSMKAPGTAYDDPRLGKDPQPDRMSQYVETTDDNGGVHINSGIPNRAFHLVATAIGGASWGAPLQVWYDALVGDIRADCDFATFAHLTIAAAKARFGPGSREAAAVASAWQTVEVTPVPARQPARRPAASTRLEVRRTGGFAGLTSQNSVRLGDLPKADAAAWRTLLASRRLDALAGDAAGGAATPDAFCYSVRCARPKVDVVVPEPALPDDVRGLLDRTLRA